MKFPRLSTLAAGLLGVVALLVVGIWIRSYFVADLLEHIYPKHPGDEGHYAMVEGERWWMSPSTAATDIEIVGGRIIWDHPYIDGAPIGWRHLTASYSDARSHLPNPLPVNWLGFYSRDGEFIVPIWPTAYAPAVIPTLFFWRKLRRHTGRGFAVDAK